MVTTLQMESPPASHFVRVGALRLHYLEWGAGSPVMVLLHGIGDHAHIWDPFAAKVADRFRVIALDQRGHGLSDWAIPAAYRCDDYVTDLAGLIDALGLTVVFLMGHSMGALHATRYASLRPDGVSGLIHADIEPCPPEWNKKYLSTLYEQIPAHYTSIDEYVDELRKNSPYAQDERLNEIASFSLTRGDDGLYRRRYDREVLSHFDRYDLRSDLRNIRCPSLILRGKESRVMREEKAREMKDQMQKGEFAEVPNATHPLHIDNPEEFQKLVSDFLDRNR
jgi:pimeloyl-ACP methyl ester carboxylesterase